MTENQQFLARFRNAAAGLIRTLIRARISQDSTFFSTEECSRWKVEDAASDERTCQTHLRWVHRLRENVERDFLSDLESIPDPKTAAEEDQFDSLLDRVASFITGDLNLAIQKATRGEVVPWDQLADWDDLGNLRDALDGLPKYGIGGDEQAVQSSSDDSEDELLEQLLSTFPKGNYQKRRIVAFLWMANRQVRWNALPREGFRGNDPPTDEAVHKALKRLQKSLNAVFDQFQVELTILEKERKVRLIKHDQDKPDK